MAKPATVPSLTYMVFVLLVVMGLGDIMGACASPADVNIWNEMGESIQTHCQSGEHDLKELTLVPGQRFGWGFTPNIWGTTLYYCNFRRGEKHQHVDVWTDFGWAGTKRRPCKHCEWHVRWDGFYRSSVGQVPVLVRLWL